MFLYHVKGDFIVDLKERKKNELFETAKELYYNKQLSIEELAEQYTKSIRTFFRWLRKIDAKFSPVPHKIKPQQKR